MAEKRIKEQERQYRLKKYGHEDINFITYWFGKFLVLVKYILYLLIAVVIVWFALIVFRIQNKT